MGVTRRSRGRRRAFTFVELLIVVAILAITAMIALPAMSDAASVRTSGVLRNVVTYVQYAQSRAILTRQRHYVRVDGTSLTLLSDGATAGTLEAVPAPDGSGAMRIAAGEANGSYAGVGIDIGEPYGNGFLLGFDEAGVPFCSPVGDPEDDAPLPDPLVFEVGQGEHRFAATVDPDTGELILE